MEGKVVSSFLIFVESLRSLHRRPSLKNMMILSARVYKTHHLLSLKKTKIELSQHTYCNKTQWNIQDKSIHSLHKSITLSIQEAQQE